MCGIVAAWSIDAPIDADLFDDARDRLGHRGPDAAGSTRLLDGRLALGHRRLSILDLSAAANQPMQLDRTWVTYNGEIYNYPELRRELEGRGCRFRTDSDTEALLHGYRAWGADLCERLDGMFAFALWDDESCRMLLGRDRLGQKPLYYAKLPDRLLVASEIKALRALAGRRLDARRESILDHVIYDYVPEPYTWYRDVRCVLPGHLLLAKRDAGGFSLEERAYWTFSPDPDPPPISAAGALEKIGSEVERSVGAHLLADVEVGAFLSGGTDSACVATVAGARLDYPIQTFSIGFGSADGDELPLAREVAQRIGSVHHEHVVGEADFRASLDRLLDVFDQPFSDTSLVPTERVAEQAARHVKVVLTGDGGDEVFGGYDLGRYVSPWLDGHFADFLHPSLGAAKGLAKLALDRLRYTALGRARWQARDTFLPPATTDWATSLVGSDLRGEVGDYDPRWAYQLHWNRALDPVRRAQWLYLKLVLPGKFLVKVDRCTMQHSLEARPPFLDHRLLEAMLDMPTELRNPRRDWYKGLFRKWLDGKVPEGVLRAPKRGFAPPAAWEPVPPQGRGPDLLRRCSEASYFAPASWSRVASRPKLLWKFLQVERALATGLL